jgi:hypothetical protein
MTYNHYKAHNMLAIMVGPCYKNMKCIWDFVWNSMVVKIVAKYNVKIIVSSFITSVQ